MSGERDVTRQGGALVLGGAGGIGGAAAKALLADGASVTIASRNDESTLR